MATVHMMHGFVGTGKTTFSKKLAQEKGIVRLSVDEWMIGLFGSNPGVNFFQLYEERVKELLWQTAARILMTCSDVILDFGFWSRAERDRYRQLARELGAQHLLYNIQCPFELIKSRVLARTQRIDRSTLYIDEHAIEEFRKRFEPVDPFEEPSLLIQTGEATSG